jgi:dienelactone hydrolase
LSGPWFTFFLKYDPAPTLQKVDAPVLALFGGKDVQVAAESNAAGLEAGLKAGGNPDVTVKTFPEANHLFQAANTGSPNEYGTLAQEFVPGFLDAISEWILARVELPAQ